MARLGAARPPMAEAEVPTLRAAGAFNGGGGEIGRVGRGQDWRGKTRNGGARPGKAADGGN